MVRGCGADHGCQHPSRHLTVRSLNPGAWMRSCLVATARSLTASQRDSNRLAFDQVTLILRGFGFAAFGKVSMTTPSLNSALMRSWSMSLESWKLRA